MAKRNQAGSVTKGATAPKTPRQTNVKPAPVKPAKPKAAPKQPKAASTKKAGPAKASPAQLKVKTEIARRIRDIREELFGVHGGPELARRLNLPARTWYNYETGVTVPAEVLLGFVEATGADPWWVLAGEGPKYRKGLAT